MNRRLVGSDDETDSCDRLMLKSSTTASEKSVKGWSNKKNLRKTDTGSDDSDDSDLDSVSSNRNECSPKEEQVSDGDFLCIDIDSHKG